MKVYRYRSLMKSGRVYAAREMSQLPTIVPVPDDVVFRNTAMVFQLRHPLPINIWVLSRVVQFYAAKLLRASFIEDLTAHWYKRQLCLLPVVANDPDLVERLLDVGEHLLAADRDIADEYARIDAIVRSGSKTLKNLIVANDPSVDGVDASGVPVASALFEKFDVDHRGIHIASVGTLIIPNPDLIKWVAHLPGRRLEAADAELARDDVLEMNRPGFVGGSNS